jgi:polar amino acid transport system substrate-binding protein
MRKISPIALILATVTCNLPRDAGGTLDRVRNGDLRAGYVVHPPWVTETGGVPGGVEVTLIEELARSLGARIAWVRGAEDELMTALESRELDVVIGGLTKDTPWKKLVGLTRPYYTDSSIVWGVTDSSRRGIKGVSVGVEAGDPAAVYLRKKGALPIVTDLRRFSGPIAAPAWEIERLRRPSSGVLLRETKQVLAVAPGENAWLLRLEELLHQRERDIPTLLRQPPR